MPCLQGAASWARDVMMVRARAPRIWTSSRGRAQGGSTGGRGRRREALGGGGGGGAARVGLGGGGGGDLERGPRLRAFS
jgi:hypothetical protein